MQVRPTRKVTKFWYLHIPFPSYVVIEIKARKTKTKDIYRPSRPVYGELQKMETPELFGYYRFFPFFVFPYAAETTQKMMPQKENDQVKTVCPEL